LAARLRLESDQSRWDDYKAYQLSKLQPFHDELSASLPHLSPDQVEIRFHLVLGAIHQIWSQCPVPEGRTPEIILRTMITFYAAGLRAPQI
jgi:hypothetical protein